MNILCKKLEKCDNTTITKHGFGFKDDKFYRLHGRIFQTLRFDQSSDCPNSFKVYVGLTPLSEKIWYGGREIEFQEFVGKERCSYDFTYDRKSKENSNKLFENAFLMLEQFVLPVVNKITDENSLIEVGESISGKEGWWFHCGIDMPHGVYALTGRFDYVVKYLEDSIKIWKETAQEGYDKCVKNKKYERAIEYLDQRDRAIPLIKKDLAAAKKGNIEYFRKTAAAIEERNREYLRLKHKIEVANVSS